MYIDGSGYFMMKNRKKNDPYKIHRVIFYVQPRTDLFKNHTKNTAKPNTGLILNIAGVDD